MLIDTHAHLNFGAYDKDREEVIRRSLESETWMINVGTNYESSKKVVEIAKSYKEGVWAAVGLHPINIKQDTRYKKQDTKISEDILEDDFDYEKYKKLAKSKKVVAIGEIGLDYWSKPKTKRRLELFKRKQQEIFLRQLDLAKELNLPVIFHCRLGHDDLIYTLKNYPMVQKLQVRVVVHCFIGSWEQAKKYLEMGFYLGFNGIIFKLELDEIIKKTPLERVLIETDCPFLMPPISINQRLNQHKSAVTRNEPLYVKHIAQRIAGIKKENFKKITEVTTQNAKNLFRI